MNHRSPGRRQYKKTYRSPRRRHYMETIDLQEEECSTETTEEAEGSTQKPRRQYKEGTETAQKEERSTQKP
jgi:hypothetical protein